MFIQLILGFIFLLLICKTFKKPSNYPPGLWGLPYIGYIPIGGKSPIERLYELKKKLGDVVLWRFGSRTMVFLFDYETIKEVLTKNDFLDRPQYQVLSLYVKDGDGNENTGLVVSNGAHWHRMRRFSLRLMRDLGMGKSRMVSAVHDEANSLVEDLKKRGNTPAPLPHSITLAVLNVIWQMIASVRYAIDDPEIIKFEDMVESFQKNASRIALVDFFPYLENILPSFMWAWLIRKDFVEEVKQKFYIFMLNYINEHKSNLDPNDPRDYVDSYLVEMEKQKDNPESNMSEKDLVSSMMDLYGAGSESTSTTIHWSIFYLANYPEIQLKLQKNVDEAMPRGTLPSLEDRPILPYLEAFIHEIHRHASFTHIGVVHSANNDTRIGKYFIPKGTTMHFMAGNVHYDPRYWKNPDDFNPERFLDENGKFEGNRQGFIPFGIGKRSCIGEELARTELLIFITALAQNFHFSPPPGKTMDLSAMSGNPFFRMTKQDQDIVISYRQ